MVQIQISTVLPSKRYLPVLHCSSIFERCGESHARVPCSGCLWLTGLQVRYSVYYRLAVYLLLLLQLLARHRQQLCNKHCMIIGEAVCRMARDIMLVQIWFDQIEATSSEVDNCPVRCMMQDAYPAG